MGSDGFKIQVDDLLAIAPTFDSCAELLSQALNAATAALDPLGSFWGDDEVGQKFAAIYQKPAADVTLLLAKTAEDLEGVYKGLADMAQKYGQTESDVTTTLHGKGFTVS